MSFSGVAIFSEVDSFFVLENSGLLQFWYPKVEPTVKQEHSYPYLDGDFYKVQNNSCFYHIMNPQIRTSVTWILMDGQRKKR